MADPQSAGGAVSASSQSSLATCTTTVTVFPCSDATSTAASSPTDSARGSIVGASPSDSQTASPSTVTFSATSAASASSDSISLVPSSTSQDTTSQPSESFSTSSTANDAASASPTSSAVFIAGPVPTATSTFAPSSSNPTPFTSTPSDSAIDSAADVQTAPQGTPSSATDGASGVVFQSSSDDASFTTATMTPTLLGTVGGPDAASTSTSGPFPLASNSLGSTNNGTVNAAGGHAQSAASKRAVIAGAAVGGTLGVLLLLVSFLFFLRRRRQAARTNTSRPLQKYLSTQGSVLGYGPDPFDRSTGIESVRTVADAFRGPGMIQHMSPAPSVHSARSIVQKLSRPDDELGEATPRSWATFQPQPSPLRESTGGGPEAVRPGPGSPPFLAVPLMTPTASDGFFSPPSGALLSTSAPGLANFSSNRSSKASSSLYSSRGSGRLADSVDPFRDSVIGGAPGPSYDNGRRRSIGDSVDPFRDDAAAPDPHLGMYSPPGRAM